MRLRPTRRAWGFLLAAFVVYVLATNTEVVWLYLVAALLLALVPVGIAGPWLTLRRVRVTGVSLSREGFNPPLPVDRGKAFAGDRLRLHLGTSIDPARLGDVRVAVLPARAEAGVAVRAAGTELEVELTAVPRGLVSITAATLSSGWPIGFAVATVTLPLDVRTLVHPCYFVAPASRRGDIAVGALESRRRGMGDQFFSLREYRSGDSQRRIHWATTARTGTLMVAETEAEVDAGHVVQLAIDSRATEDTVELALSVAASFAARAVARGEPVRMVLGAESLTGWREILGRLATWTGGTGPPAPGEATRVSAAPEGLVVDALGLQLRLPPGAGLDAAERALRGQA